jgi:hypothetical protein
MAVTQTAEGAIVALFATRPLAEQFRRQRTELVAKDRCRFEKAAQEDLSLGRLGPVLPCSMVAG